MIPIKSWVMTPLHRNDLFSESFNYLFRSCFDGRPEVYTRVSSYMDWITATMDKYDLQESRRNLFNHRYGINNKGFNHRTQA